MAAHEGCLLNSKWARLKMSITFTSKKNNLTIGRWYWPNAGYEITIAGVSLSNLLASPDMALFEQAVAQGDLASSAPLSAGATPIFDQSVDDSVGREVRAVIDDYDRVQLVALGFGPISVEGGSNTRVVDNVTEGGTSEALSAEQGRILAQTKYAKPEGGIPASDLSISLQTAVAKANTSYQKPTTGIPSTDLSAEVQTYLSKAQTALQQAPVSSVAGKTGSVILTKGDVGLSNVDDTSDMAKPVSNAQATAIAQAKAEAKAESIAAAPVQSVSGKTGAVSLVKSDVGLSNVDNTSDSAKPVSTAQAAAIAQAKAEAISGSPVQSVSGKTGAVVLQKGDVGLGNVDNTSDADKPVSVAQANAIGSKYTKPAGGIPAEDLTISLQSTIQAAAGIKYVIGAATTTISLSDIGLSGRPFTFEVSPDVVRDTSVSVKVDVSYNGGTTYQTIGTYTEYTARRWVKSPEESDPTHLLVYRASGTSVLSEFFIGA